MPYTLYLTPHTSHPTPHALHALPHTPYPTPHTPCLTRFYLTPHTSHPHPAPSTRTLIPSRPPSTTLPPAVPLADEVCLPGDLFLLWCHHPEFPLLPFPPSLLPPRPSLLLTSSPFPLSPFNLLPLPPPIPLPFSACGAALLKEKASTSGLSTSGLPNPKSYPFDSTPDSLKPATPSFPLCAFSPNAFVGVLHQRVHGARDLVRRRRVRLEVPHPKC